MYESPLLFLTRYYEKGTNGDEIFEKLLLIHTTRRQFSSLKSAKRDFNAVFLWNVIFVNMQYHCKIIFRIENHLYQSWE